MEHYWLHAVRVSTSVTPKTITHRDISFFPGAENIVKIWNPLTGELMRNLAGHTAGLSDLSWSNDSVYLASASDDTTIRIWEVDTVRRHEWHIPSAIYPNFDERASAISC